MKSVLHLEPLSSILECPPQEVDWILEGLLAKGCLSLLFGKPKTGKSTFVRALIAAVADGSGFLGASTSRSGVIYLALEDHPIFSDALYRNLSIRNKDNVLIQMGQSEVCSNEEMIAALEAEIDLYKPGLVVIDTLFKAFRVRDTNDYGPVTDLLAKILRLARSSQTHIMLVHHGRKGDATGFEAALGSTGILAGVDDHVHLHRSGEVMSLSFQGRYVAPYSIDCRMTAAGELISVGSEERLGLAEKILAVLQEGDFSRTELRVRVSCRQSDLDAAISGLEARALVFRLGNGAKGSRYIFSSRPPNPGEMAAGIESQGVE